MKNRTAIKIATPSVLLVAVLALTSRTVIAQTKIQGVIDGRSGPTMSLKTPDSPPDTTVPRPHQADAHDRAHSRPPRPGQR